MADDSRGSEEERSADASIPDDGLDAATPGFTDLVGLEITDVEEGYSRTALEVADEHRNPYGGVHGAVLYAMADTGMGAALLPGVEPGERMATIEIKISYVRPVTEGTVTCETTVLNRGRSVAYLESEIQNEGRLVARASGSFSIFEL
jgi:acyl-CoA thioesterase